MTRKAGTYKEMEEYINGIPKFSGKNSIEDTRLFLRHIGDPMRDRKVIHIAGTNGKGSVCAYLSSVLGRAGIRAGMFTSPHLETMRERMAVDGRIATEEEFAEAFRAVADGLRDMPPALADKGYHPSFFEFLFFMAALFFKKADVEYVILETGLGGRLDATNAVADKALCVITSVGYDHMEYLGDTLAQIAAEKAGILRPGVKTVYWAGRPEVSARLAECAARIGAPAAPVSREAVKELNIKNKTIDFSLRLNYYGYIGFTVSTTALYQVENAALAATAVAALEDGRITAADLQAGIRGMAWAGRMEEILPSVYLDGAHNIDGVQAFLETVERQPCGGRRRLLFAVVKEKQYEAMIRRIAESGLFDEIGAAPLASERGLAADREADLFRQYTGAVCRAYGSAGAAFEGLVSGMEDGDITYIAGSLYLAGEIKALLRRSRHDQF